MRIIEGDNYDSFNSVEIFMTFEEAEDFEGKLSSHCEIDWVGFYDAGNINGYIDGYDVRPGYMEFYIYTDKNIDSFSDKAKNLIINDSL